MVKNNMVIRKKVKIKLTLYIALLVTYISIAQPLQERNKTNFLPVLNQIENLNLYQNHSSIFDSKKSNYPSFYHVITDVPKDFLDFGSSIFRYESIVPIVLLSTVITGLIFYDHKAWQYTKKIVNSSNSLNSITHTFV